ncbi:hypothetical protein ACLOJK_028359 [Asimina triloba]
MSRSFGSIFPKRRYLKEREGNGKWGMLKLGSFSPCKEGKRDENESTLDWKGKSAASATAWECVSADEDEAAMGRNVWVLHLQLMVVICSVRGRAGEALFVSFREGSRKEDTAIGLDWRLIPQKHPDSTFQNQE